MAESPPTAAPGVNATDSTLDLKASWKISVQVDVHRKKIKNNFIFCFFPELDVNVLMKGWSTDLFFHTAFSIEFLLWNIYINNDIHRAPILRLDNKQL